MPIRKPKPTSPGMRFVSYPDFTEITRSEPEKRLVEGLTKSGGRNRHGRKTARHRGGGAKRAYRRVDFTLATLGNHTNQAAVDRRTLLELAAGFAVYELPADEMQKRGPFHGGQTLRSRSMCVE